ncbi:MAG TPA: hypothetical protein VJU83_09600 [Burkholderiales bacterium]|nr:hypothetical protein [Burkholderiales bacterium]
MPLLNGKQVAPGEIDPSRHRFIGTWRPPEPPVELGIGFFLCRCSREYSFNESAAFDHWQRGHFDEPQYVDIERSTP